MAHTINNNRDMGLLVVNTFSYTASILNIISLVVNGKLMKRAGRLILFLSLSDFIGSFFYFLQILEGDEGDDINCVSFAAFTFWGFMAAGFWSCAIGAELYLTAVKNKRIPETVYHVICWSVPTLVLIIAFSLGDFTYYTNHVKSNDCTRRFPLNHTPIYTVPQLLCVAWNIIMISMLIYQIQFNKSLYGPGFGRCSSQTRLLMMQCCYLIYSVGLLMRVVSNQFYPSSCITSSQGFFHTIATNLKAITTRCKLCKPKRESASFSDLPLAMGKGYKEPSSDPESEFNSPSAHEESN